MVATGSSAPFGASILRGGVNFSVFSKNATRIELLLFDDANAADAGPDHPARRRTPPDVSLLARVRAGPRAWPGLRVSRAWTVRAGTRAAVRCARRCFSIHTGSPSRYPTPTTACRDAAGRQRAGRDEERRRRSRSLRLGRRSAAQAAVRRDHHLRTPRARLHAASELGVRPETSGTYAGLIEKIPYLEDLGVTAVELLPVFQFDPQDAPRGRVNYWGYQPVSFFAPHHAYSSRKDPLGVLDEFRDMVKALHRAGHRSHPRRRLQSHDRRRRGWPDVVLSRPWPTTSTTSSRRTSRATPTTPAAATR